MGEEGSVVTKRVTKKAANAGAEKVSAVMRQMPATRLIASARSGSKALAAENDTRFADVVALIEAAKSRAYQAVNAELVTLYWQLGEHISRKIASAEWGDGVVEELAAALARRYPGLRGFTRPNLFRMRQFYEAYRDNEKVSALLIYYFRKSSHGATNLLHVTVLS
jgi:hypothetical protein